MLNTSEQQRQRQQLQQSQQQHRFKMDFVTNMFVSLLLLLSV